MADNGIIYAPLIPIQDAYKDFCRTLGFPIDESLIPTFTHGDPLSPTPHRISDAMSVALGGLGSELAALWKIRTGEQEKVTIDGRRSLAQLMAVYFNTTMGVSCIRLMDEPRLLALSDWFPDKDGRYIFLLNMYPNMRDKNCKVLKCAPYKEDFAEAVAKRSALEIEEEINALGGTAIALRTPKEWLETPPGNFLANTPLVEIEKMGEADPLEFKPVSDKSKGKPLEGLKVLDNTHVFAGPISSRMAAENGAEVLNTIHPDHTDPLTLVTETHIGKTSAWFDVNKDNERAKFWDLLSEADVYVSSWRNLANKGLGHEELVKHRPGLVIVDYHAFGADGPWQKRGGLDQLAMTATGFAYTEGYPDKPRLPPTELLNDYLAGVLGATGMMECLRRRATEGGSWRARVVLSKVCMWVQSLGILPREDVMHFEKPTVEKLSQSLEYNTVKGGFGETKYIPTQFGFTEGKIKPGLTKGSEPNGASPLEWPSKVAKA